MAEVTPPRPTRRQLSLFLPEAQRSLVDPIRQRLDPIQHALIPAHVTLCRDEELPEWRELTQRLEGLGQFSITMQFGDPLELPDGCVLLRQTVGTEQFQHLRQSILGTASRASKAHLTLLHPRNATGALHDLAAIGRELAGLVVTFRTISLIEQCGCDPWQVKGEYGAAI
jgi:hypothetical protein